MMLLKKKLVVMISVLACCFTAQGDSARFPSSIASNIEFFEKNILLICSTTQQHALIAPSHKGMSMVGDLFEHPLARWIVHKLSSSTNGSALCIGWRKFKENMGKNEQEDKLFLRELAEYIYIFYEQALGQNKKTEISGILEFYFKIAALPWGELFTLISSLHDQIKELFLSVTEESGSGSTPIGFLAFATKFWWVPPVTLAAILMAYLGWRAGFTA